MRNAALINELLEGLNSVPENRRPGRLYVEAGRLARLGWSQNKTTKLLLQTAERCNQPLHEAWVYLVVERLYREPPRAETGLGESNDRHTLREWAELLWIALRGLASCLIRGFLDAFSTAMLRRGKPKAEGLKNG